MSERILSHRSSAMVQRMKELNSQDKRGMAFRLRELRLAAGFSQADLAKKVGTTQSVIARLENANYDRHSLYTLRRIAAALNQRVQIVFLPEEGSLDSCGGNSP